jgi:cell division septation protein DedD
VIGTLAALGLVAFALGAGAGLMWKDPGLVMAQWGGDTQEVAWSDPTAAAADVEGFQDASSGPLPDVEVPSREAADAARPAAAPSRAADTPYQTASAEPVKPLASSERKAAPASTPAPTPAPRKETPREEARADALPPVSAPPPALRGVAVQVGAFSDRRAADQLIARLRSDGFQAYASAGAGSAWRVRVGPFRDRSGADQAAARLKRDQKLPTWVLEETGER